MKLGAQLYSVRKNIQTAEDTRRTFERIKEIGYKTVQFSGAPTKDAALLKSLSEEFNLPIVCTHVSFDRLTEEIDDVIAEHKVFGCPVIGLGSMPKDLRHSVEGLNAFFEKMEKPVGKILDAGLKFAYHNHAFEFEKIDGGNECYYDLMLEKCENWQFIADSYWIEFAGGSAPEYFKKVGSARLTNVHFKDMNKDREICACGAGTLDFAALAQVCRELGVENVLVEQDNAAELDDPFEAMKFSFEHLNPIIG